MTLNDLECPIHLKVRLVDGTLDVRLWRVSDSTIRIGVARGSGGGVGWRAYPPPRGQLTRCFSAVAELLVSVCSRRLPRLCRERGLYRLLILPKVIILSGSAHTFKFHMK